MYYPICSIFLFLRRISILTVDLHTHTKLSDGTFSLKELADYAVYNGIKHLAITDHDCVKAFLEEDVNSIKGLTFIKGIELGCIFKETELHILGYGIDIFSSKLTEVLSFLSQKREERMLEMISKLKILGFEIDYNEIVAESKEIKGRMHLARALCKKRIVKNEQSAFTKYLSYGCPAYVPKISLSAEQTISLIKSIGGIPVIAHPFVSKITEPLLKQIISLGIEGIEVYHPKHNEIQKHFLKNEALKQNLLITGGSDFHGIKDGTTMQIGSHDYPYEFFIEFSKRLQEKI